MPQQREHDHPETARFKALFDQYEGALFRYALHLAGTEDGARDLYQETWLRVAFRGKGLYHEAGRELDADIERILWLTPGEIRARSSSLRSPMVLRSLEDCLAGNSAPLTLLAEL